MWRSSQITFDSTPLGGTEVEWWLRDAVYNVRSDTSALASGREPLAAVAACNPHEYVLRGLQKKAA